MQQPVPAMQPQHQPVASIGVLPVFAVPTPTTLVIKEKVLSLSGDDFACAALSYCLPCLLAVLKADVGTCMLWYMHLKQGQG